MYLENIVFSLLVILPNLLFVIFPPVDVKEYEGENKNWVEIVEKVGQVGIFVLPLFYQLNKELLNSYIIILLIIFIILYYIGWLRFFIWGRFYKLLFSPMFKIPIPLAISPILYFLMVAYVLQSWVLFAFVVLFSIGHIPISYNHYMNSKS